MFLSMWVHPGWEWVLEVWIAVMSVYAITENIKINIRRHYDYILLYGNSL